MEAKTKSKLLKCILNKKSMYIHYAYIEYIHMHI